MLVESTIIAVSLAIATIAVSSALFDTLGSFSGHTKRSALDLNDSDVVGESCDAKPFVLHTNLL